MRLGILSYINSLPLTYGLELGEIPFAGQVVQGEPSLLNREARAGRLDVSAVSAAEVAASPGSYSVVPGVCLASRGPVQSVLLSSRIPLEELPGRQVAITRASATSRILLQLLAPGIVPVDLPLESGPDLLSEEVPGVLLIGDRALRPVSGASMVYDLGELWTRRTGLPMVFALWVARRPEHLPGARAALQGSKEWGLRNRGRVVEEACRRAGLSPARVEAYYGRLSYDLDEAAMAGLTEYCRQAVAAGLLPAGVESLRVGSAA